MCNYRGVDQQMNRESNLQIICSERWCGHSGHVTDALGKTKEKCQVTAE